MPVTAVALMGATAVSLGASPEASTIQNGWVQLCAGGGYDAQFDVLPTGKDGFTGETHASAPANSCFWEPVNTYGQNTMIVLSEGDGQYIGTVWYNSDSGIGIGTEGSAGSPTFETW
ncbi:hypothetical protein GXW82_43020 [Streptacidiphilus sp. 4-A2]|nr:hypothetical protein [Streptacidiphilus sp. 4-A2]